VPTPLEVEHQRFTFGDTWTRVFKYDDTGFYRSKVERHLKQTKAVDVLGVHTSEGLLLLEVKDFRGHRIANKKRLSNGDLAMEVALKVKDTVAGVIGACRGGVKDFENPGKHIVSKEKLIVVLWLEDDTSQNLLDWKGCLHTINQKIKECLAWLGPVRTFVQSSRTDNRLPDLEVTNLKKS
jgi:hypothetical protein